MSEKIKCQNHQDGYNSIFTKDYCYKWFFPEPLVAPKAECQGCIEERNKYEAQIKTTNIGDIWSILNDIRRGLVYIDEKI